jgi:hypothetical protein
MRSLTIISGDIESVSLSAWLFLFACANGEPGGDNVTAANADDGVNTACE